jgi:phage shock protein PspC (stress-responsive transcriptional regulator)
MPEFDDFKGKKLYRSQTNRMIGGVCGGVAEYFAIDPTLVRIIWVAISLIGGFGILVYVASLFIIPNNPEESSEEASENLIKDKNLFWGSLLIIVGLFLILRQMGLFYSFQFWHVPWQSVWAIVLITIGGILLYNRSRQQKEGKGDDSTEMKRLYRSRNQKMIAGLCGGIAEYFELDATIIRILWVIGTFITAGVGVIIYVIMIFLFPEKPEQLEDKTIET